MSILGMVLREGFSLVIAGIAIGLAAALALTRYLSTLLYAVRPTDPIVYAGVSAVLAAAALAGCYFPSPPRDSGGPGRGSARRVERLSRGRETGTPAQTGPHQKMYFSATCRLRMLPRVPVMTPKLLGLPALVSGFPQLGWLGRLNASKRTCI